MGDFNYYGIATPLDVAFTDNNTLCHYGRGHLDGGHSGRYPYGSGKKNDLKKLKKKLDSNKKAFSNAKAEQNEAKTKFKDAKAEYKHAKASASPFSPKTALNKEKEKVASSKKDYKTSKNNTKAAKTNYKDSKKIYKDAVTLERDTKQTTEFIKNFAKISDKNATREQVYKALNKMSIKDLKSVYRIHKMLESGNGDKISMSNEDKNALRKAIQTISEGQAAGPSKGYKSVINAAWSTYFIYRFGLNNGPLESATMSYLSTKNTGMVYDTLDKNKRNKR